MTPSCTGMVLDDIPLLVGLLRQLRLPEILESALGTHGNTRLIMGLDNGLALSVWLVYLLSAGDHRKVVLADWVAQHAEILSFCFETPVTSADFSDDRLSTLMIRLQQPACWEQVEIDFFSGLLKVYDPGAERLHVDATTAYGYHDPHGTGLMQMGYAKSGMPTGLAQVKLMGATTSRGQLVACTVVPGNTSDSPLYIPLIQRVRRQLGTGRLYVGDCKMATLPTREDLVAHGDTYIVPLSRTETGGNPTEWLRNPEVEWQQTTLLWRQAMDPEKTALLGGVWETTRTVTRPTRSWQERVLIVYSRPLAKKQAETLAGHLAKATQAILALTPPPKRGRPQFHEGDKLDIAIKTILKREGVEDVLKVTYQAEEGSKRKAGRLVITAVTQEKVVLAARREILGWRVLVTNEPKEKLAATDVLLDYREEYVVERFFHVLKDQPVGLRPFWVRTDKQIRGIAYFLTIAARVMTYMEHRLQDTLVEQEEKLAGLHPGQSHLKTDHPTAKRVLETFARIHPLRIGISTPMGEIYQIVNLTPLLSQIVKLLGLPEDVYTRLDDTS